MRILIDARTASDRFPGVGRYISSLTRALRPIAKGHELLLLKQRGQPQSELELPDLRVVECTSGPLSLSQQWAVRSVVASTRADLYFSPYVLVPYWPGVPSVVVCHDVIPLTCPQFFPLHTRAAFRLAYRVGFRRATAIIVSSDATRADLVAHYPDIARKITVVHLASDLADARPAASPPRFARPDRYVLYVGSNRPHKNLARLISAWTRLVEAGAHAGCHLVIAGPVDQRFALPDDAASHTAGTSVTWLGRVSDDALRELYRHAALFVFPSVAEGFGLPPLEAMSFGTPVACSNIPTMSEVALGAAALFDPFDVADIAETLSRLLQTPDELARLAAAGRQRAAHFSWNRTARETLSVLEHAGAA